MTSARGQKANSLQHCSSPQRGQNTLSVSSTVHKANELENSTTGELHSPKIEPLKFPQRVSPKTLRLRHWFCTMMLHFFFLFSFQCCGKPIFFQMELESRLSSLPFFRKRNGYYTAYLPCCSAERIISRSYWVRLDITIGLKRWVLV